MTLGGNFNSGMAQAEQGLSRMNATAATAGTHASALSTAFGKVGGALSHAGSRLKEFGSGLLALGGVGGLLGVGALLGSAVRKVEDFGAALEKVTTLTGESALAAGTLILEFQKFGLGADKITQVVGFTEKSLGNLHNALVTVGTGKTKEIVDKLAILQDQYGVALEDSKGKVLSFSQVLTNMAAYYDSSASASDKASLAAKVFGRGYTAMIPILNEGAAGLRAAAEQAKSLGLNSTDTVRQLAEFHDQMHLLEQQVNLLQLGIGTALLPTLIDLSTAATDFVSGHRADIANFFRNAASAAKTAVGALVDFGKGIASVWNGIPPEFRDMLVKSVVADRTVKFLFGFSPIGSLVSGIEGALSKGLGNAVGTGLAQAGLGKLFVQPVFVTNPGFGAGNLAGGLGGAAEAGGLAAAGLGTLAVGVAGILAAYWLPQMLANPNGPGAKGASVTGSQGQSLGSLSWQQVGMSGNNVANMLAAQGNTGAGATWDHGTSGAVIDLTKATRDMGYEVDNAVKNGWQSAASRIVGAIHDLKLGQYGSAKELLAGIKARSAAEHGGKALGQGAIDATFTRDIIHKVGVIQASGYSSQAKLTALQALLKTSDGHSTAGTAAVKRAIDADTAAIRAKKLAVSVTVPVTVNQTISSRDIYVSQLVRSRGVHQSGQSAYP